MIDIGLLSSALGSVQAVRDIASSMVGMKTAAEVNAKAIELQGVILSLHGDIANAIAAQAQLAQENQQLKNQLAEIEDFRSDATNYKIVELLPGIFVYGRKEPIGHTELPHYLCTNCYQSRKKSILQMVMTGGWLHINCPCCATSLHTQSRRPPPLHYAE